MALVGDLSEISVRRDDCISVCNHDYVGGFIEQLELATQLLRGCFFITGTKRGFASPIFLGYYGTVPKNEVDERLGNSALLGPLLRVSGIGHGIVSVQMRGVERRRYG